MTTHYSYIHTFIGQAALAVILLASLWGIYSPKVHDGILGRCLYMAKALVCIAGFSHIANETFPRNIAITLIVCVAIHMVRDLVVAHYKYPFRLWWTQQQNRARQVMHEKNKR